MVCNIGKVDRAVRFIVGLALLSLLFLLDGNARWWGLVGLGPLVTSMVGYCPPYQWMGIDTTGKTTETTVS